jgi:hypothetical protein
VDDDFAFFGGRDFRFDDFEVVRRARVDGEVSLLHVGHDSLGKLGWDVGDEIAGSGGRGYVDPPTSSHDLWT